MHSPRDYAILSMPQIAAAWQVPSYTRESDVFNRLSGVRRLCKVLVSIALCLPCMVLITDQGFANTAVTSADLRKKLVTTHALASQEQTDGRSELATALAKIKSLSDYTVDSGVVTYAKKKDVVEVGKYFVKKPRLIRVEVLKAGSKSGSVVVLRADGQIKARPGKMLKFAKLNLSADSDMLKTANGYSLLEADIESLLSGVVTDLEKGPRKCVVSSKALMSPVNNQNVRVVEVYGANGQVEQRIAIGESTKLPVEWTILKNGDLFSTSVWKNAKLNSGLSDSLFTLSKS
jgi:outer membrane lipoprotein-sorting protein